MGLCCPRSLYSWFRMKGCMYVNNQKIFENPNFGTVQINADGNKTNELQIMSISGIDCYEHDGIAYLKLETVA